MSLLPTISLFAFKALKKLKHPNIVNLIEVFRDDYRSCLVFECMDCDLNGLADSRKKERFPDDFIIRVSKQVLDGLAYIHQLGFFHRDMKPENILIRGSDLNTMDAKIADFGLVHDLDFSRPLTDYISTRWYRAPEVLLNCHTYSMPIDVWAVGTIIAEMAMHRPLFPGNNQLDQLRRIFHVLGTPSASQHEGSLWYEGAMQARKMGVVFTQTTKKPLRKVMQDVSPRIINIVAYILCLNPAQRPTAKDGLTAISMAPEELAALVAEHSSHTPATADSPSSPHVNARTPSSQKSSTTRPKQSANTIKNLLPHSSSLLDRQAPTTVPLKSSSPTVPKSAASHARSPYININDDPPSSPIPSLLANNLNNTNSPSWSFEVSGPLRRESPNRSKIDLSDLMRSPKPPESTSSMEDNSRSQFISDALTKFSQSTEDISTMIGTSPLKNRIKNLDIRPSVETRPLTTSSADSVSFNNGSLHSNEVFGTISTDHIVPSIEKFDDTQSRIDILSPELIRKSATSPTNKLKQRVPLPSYYGILAGSNSPSMLAVEASKDQSSQNASNRSDIHVDSAVDVESPQLSIWSPHSPYTPKSPLPELSPPFPTYSEHLNTLEVAKERALGRRRSATMGIINSPSAATSIDNFDTFQNFTGSISNLNAMDNFMSSSEQEHGSIINQTTPSNDLSTMFPKLTTSGPGNSHDAPSPANSISGTQPSRIVNDTTFKSTYLFDDVDDNTLPLPTPARRPTLTKSRSMNILSLGSSYRDNVHPTKEQLLQDSPRYIVPKSMISPDACSLHSTNRTGGITYYRGQPSSTSLAMFRARIAAARAKNELDQSMVPLNEAETITFTSINSTKQQIPDGYIDHSKMHIPPLPSQHFSTHYNSAVSKHTQRVANEKRTNQKQQQQQPPPPPPQHQQMQSQQQPSGPRFVRRAPQVKSLSPANNTRRPPKNKTTVIIPSYGKKRPVLHGRQHRQSHPAVGELQNFENGYVSPNSQFDDSPHRSSYGGNVFEGNSVMYKRSFESDRIGSRASILSTEQTDTTSIESPEATRSDYDASSQRFSWVEYINTNSDGDSDSRKERGKAPTKVHIQNTQRGFDKPDLVYSTSNDNLSFRSVDDSTIPSSYRAGSSRPKRIFLPIRTTLQDRTKQ